MATGVVIAGLSPHPPIVVPEVGGSDTKKVQSTLRALRTLAAEVVKARPDTLILIGPHGPVFRDAIACDAKETIRGDLSGFGAPGARVSFKNDIELALRVKQLAEASPSRTTVVMIGESERSRYRVSEGCAHDAVVPLYFLNEAGLDSALVLFTMGFLPHTELYEFGTLIARAAQDLGRRVAVIASGDLSHRLTPDAPAGYNPRGREFDELVMAALGNADPEPLVHIDEALEEDAGECGLRPIIMMLGSLDGRQVTARVLSYEGPFGVGYGVVLLTPGQPDEKRKFAAKWRAEALDKLKKLRESESAHVALARLTLEKYVHEHKRVSASSAPQELLSERAGVFVSLKKRGQLRGCIGTIEPTTGSIAEEIIQNAISAGTEDPRFPPVQPEELDEIVYSVDVLSPAEPVKSPDELDPKHYGVIVEKGGHRGLLLPDLEGIDTVEKQLRIAKQKAGLRPDEPNVKLYRFKVTRYH